jgi:hypothetical protein
MFLFFILFFQSFRRYVVPPSGYNRLETILSEYPESFPCTAQALKYVVGRVLERLFAFKGLWTGYAICARDYGSEWPRHSFSCYGSHVEANAVSFRALVTRMCLTDDILLDELATARVAGWELCWEQGFIRFKNGLLSTNGLTEASGSVDIRAVQIDIAAKLPPTMEGRLESWHYKTFTLGDLDDFAISCFLYNRRIVALGTLAGQDSVREGMYIEPVDALHYYLSVEVQELWYVLLERLLLNDRKGKSPRILIPVQGANI